MLPAPKRSFGRAPRRLLTRALTCTGKKLEGECPLRVKHPPTGEEYALGCGVCRNTQTF